MDYGQKRLYLTLIAEGVLITLFVLLGHIFLVADLFGCSGCKALIHATRL